MRTLHRILLSTIAGIALIAASTTKADTAKAQKVKARLAFVDVDRCVGETEDGLRAKALLKKFSDRKQMQIANVEDNLKNQQNKLTAMAQSTGPTPQLTAAVLDYQRQLQSYNDLLKRVNAEIAAREDELFSPIEKKVKGIFTRIGDAENFDLIVDRKAAPLTKPELDLTERVIAEYNWGQPGTVGSAKPTASATASASIAPKPSASAAPPAASASAKK